MIDEENDDEMNGDWCDNDMIDDEIDIPTSEDNGSDLNDFVVGDNDIVYDENYDPNSANDDDDYEPQNDNDLLDQIDGLLSDGMCLFLLSFFLCCFCFVFVFLFLCIFLNCFL